MRKALFAMAAFMLLSTCQIFAQDLITLKDGTDIQAKVLEITPTELKYKKYNNQEGPTFTILKKEILMVRYENGEKDVFNDTPTTAINYNTNQSIKQGMRYSEYKDLYDKSMYIHQIGDPYSPGWAGVASFFIPGLGQGISDEWGRAAWICAVNIVLGIVSIGTYPSFYNYINYYNKPFPTVYFASTIGRLAFDIWSIVDAVKVAKIKNMYYQDMRVMQLTQVNVSVSPFLYSTPNLGNGCQPVTGLSLNFSF